MQKYCRASGTSSNAARKGKQRTFLLILLLLTLSVANGRPEEPLEFQNNLPAMVIWAAPGKDVELPCDLTPTSPGDRINMVLWFKDSAGIPLYTLDSRGGPLNKAAHLAISDNLGSRTYFVPNEDPSKSKLRIHNVQMQDEGTFRCRVDFFDSPTRNSRVNLTLIVQPSFPQIYDSQGEEVISEAGPFLEGLDLLLSCQVSGGRPRPSVTWWLNGSLLDGVIDRAADSRTTINQLSIQKVNRSLKNARLECRAVVSDMVEPLVKVTPLIIYLKPTRVRIVSPNELLSVRKPQPIRCETVGSYPPAKIDWFLDGRHILDSAVAASESAGVTSSVVALQTSPEDDGRELICRSDNPRLPGGSMDDRRTLHVAYPPRVAVKLDARDQQQQKEMKEGEDVKLHCEAVAKPEPHKYTWYHNAKSLETNKFLGIYPQDGTLELKNISASQIGDYSCEATNNEGSGRSLPFHLRIQYAPRCKAGAELNFVGAVANEGVLVKCEIDSDPRPSRFSWTFNSSRDVLPVQGSRPGQDGYSSLLHFTPGHEFGTLACWASNAVGRQTKPCLFNLIPANKPSPPEHCVLLTPETELLQVVCVPGEDGGLPQKFILEVLEAVWSPNSPHGTTTTTMSDEADRPAPILKLWENEPRFKLHELPPNKNYQFLIFAENAKGRSTPPVSLNNIRTKEAVAASAVGRDGHRADSRSNPPPFDHPLALIMAAVIAGAALVMAGVIASAVVVLCRRRPPSAPAPVVLREKKDRGKRQESFELDEGASECGFGEGFQRRSMEWRERKLRATFYTQADEAGTSSSTQPAQGPDLILSPVSLAQPTSDY